MLSSWGSCPCILRIIPQPENQVVRGVRSWFLGLRSRQGFRRLPSLAHPIRADQLPEQHEEHKFVEKWVGSHLIPFPCRSHRGMLPFFSANELSAGCRHTTLHFSSRIIGHVSACFH